MSNPAYDYAYEAWKRTDPEAGHHFWHEKALATVNWQKKSSAIVIEARTERWLWVWRIAVLLALIAEVLHR
jgi:hypothetical protein